VRGDEGGARSVERQGIRRGAVIDPRIRYFVRGPGDRRRSTAVWRGDYCRDDGPGNVGNVARCVATGIRREDRVCHSLDCLICKGDGASV